MMVLDCDSCLFLLLNSLQAIYMYLFHNHMHIQTVFYYTIFPTFAELIETKMQKQEEKLN